MSKLMKSVSAAALGLMLVSCTPYQERVDPAAVAAEELAIEARSFLGRVETELAAMNREAALARLQALVDQAAHPPIPRKPTRPTRASVQRRIEGKTRRGAVKAVALNFSAYSP